jgi:putative transposase
MTYDKNKYNRRSIRLKEYDYASPGWYFVTICTHQQNCLFGDIQNGKMVFSPIGKIAQEFWLEIPSHFKNIELDEFVIMPNHIHGVIIINDNGWDNGKCRGVRSNAPTPRPLIKPW